MRAPTANREIVTDISGCRIDHMTSGSNHGKQHPWCSRALPPSAAAAAAAAAAEVRKNLPGGADLEDDFVTVAAQTTDATNPAMSGAC